MDEGKVLNKERVLEYFYQLSKVPHASGEEAQIADYLEEQGRRLGLSVFRDEVNNVILKKEGRSGSDPVILQAHVDMVWESENPGAVKGVPYGIHIENGKMKTRGTTLGADDGIGVALMLALLEEETEQYPGLEAVFTVNEEETMEGAMALKEDSLSGSRLINLDSEEEGILTVGAAGGSSVICTIPYLPKSESRMKQSVKIVVDGCKGGHSGLEIHEDRQNAILLLVRFLQTLEEGSFELAAISGGSRSNAIPESAEAIINTEDPDHLIGSVEKFRQENQSEWEEETDLRIRTEKMEYREFVYSKEQAERLLILLENLPHGVRKRSGNFIYSSSNLATVKENGSGLIVEISLRSNYEGWLADESKRIGRLIQALGGSAEYTDAYPAFLCKKDSGLTNLFKQEYQTLFGREVICDNVHAGVECGIIMKNCSCIKEAISLGPTILNAHTVNEELDVESVGMLYDLLDRVLKATIEE